jgi:hypothetical protein
MPGLASEDDRLVYRCLRGAGEMNFAPTTRAQPLDDETVDGSGRNEFRPYNVGGNA